MNPIAADILMHYGVSCKDDAPGRGSGRYPLGSGLNPYQHGAEDLLARYNKLKKQGYSNAEIAEKLNVCYKGKPSSARLMTQVSLATNARRMERVSQAERLWNEGKGYTEIGRAMGISDNSAKSLLNQARKDNTQASMVTAEYLKDIIDKTGKAIDVGEGVETELGITRTKLDKALYILELNGYQPFNRGRKQSTNQNQQTNLKLIGPANMTWKEAYDDNNVASLHDYTDTILINNGTEIRKGFVYPASLDPKRLQIRYAEEGGIEKDGVIELRRGVKDISLGESNYAQVRILVDGTHYLKGMAVYSDNMPDGVDVIFNTNKPKGTPALGETKVNSVLKPIGKDPENPFNSLIKEKGGQSYYDDPKGKFTDPITGNKQSLSLINKRADEGDWGEWSDNLPAQFLSKQSKKLIDQQLKLTENIKEAELNDILELTNNTVKKKLLADFAGKCDSDAVHLKAAALPRQKYQVILPIPSIGDNEIYAPNYENGSKVALIRYPHASISEIPILTVNNKNKEGDRVITKNGKDAVGISKNNADRLSGADFDGDTVQVIPIGSKSNIINAPIPEQMYEPDGSLFDAKTKYGPGSTDIPYKKMGKATTQQQMGVVTNLITDMTIGGAPSSDIVKAMKHSQVVIDAEKHELDYKRSEKDNDIAALKKRWQKHYDVDGNYKESGAATLVSRAKAVQYVTKRKGSARINPEDGSLYWKDDPDATYDQRRIIYKKDEKGHYLKDAKGEKIPEIDPKTNKPLWEYTGKKVTRTQRSTQMAETPDARTLISELRSPVEIAYADYANHMKALANRARKEMISTKAMAYDKGAAEIYKPQVDSLNEKLRVAELKKPRVREAERLATLEVNQKILSEPGIEKDKKAMAKLNQQAITKARAKVGIDRYQIEVTPNEWEAIQSGALHDTTVAKILNYSDMDLIREYASPRRKNGLSSSKLSILKSMLNADYTNEQIANRLGISVSTVQQYRN